MTNVIQPSKTSRFFGQYIIKSGFQFKFSLLVFACLAGLAFFIWLEGNVIVKNMIANGSVTSEDGIAQLHLLKSIIGKTCVLGLAVTFGLALFFSHFIAGPIYRFQRVLEEIQTGKLTMHVRLRPHDEFKDVADSFNQALASLRVKVREERTSVNVQADKIGELVEVLKSKGAVDEASQLKALVADLKQLPTRIQI